VYLHADFGWKLILIWRKTMTMKWCVFSCFAIPGRRRPDEMLSNTRLKASPGLMLAPPLLTHFSTSNSIAWQQTESFYFVLHFIILYFHVNYLILLIGWENLDKIYCRPLTDETTPRSVQKHNNSLHCMTTVNILKNTDR
jgi:hypothetical protein